MASEKLKRLNALYLVSIGKASPEQQVIAYEVMLERIEAEKQEANRPSRQNKDLKRSLLVYMISRCYRSEGEEISQADACAFVAESRGVQVETVKRNYRKWKASRSEAEQEKEANRYGGDLLSLLI